MPNPRRTSSASARPVIAGFWRDCARAVGSLLTLIPLLAASLLLSGCLVLHPPCELDDQVYYRTLAETPMSKEENPTGFRPVSTATPLLIDVDQPPPTWDMALDEAVRLGLENAKVLRDLQSNVLQRPDLAQTIHDPAIQATDPRFGMDGALAAFDAQFSTRLFAYKNDRAFNNLFAGGGTFLFRQDLENYVSELKKTTATGATFAMRQHIDYDSNNAPANLFPSYFNVDFEGEFRQPLLQGGGVMFNRIAGPGALPGQVNGVVIARINNDVTVARFEANVRDLISNIENGYWDLYYAYRELDARIAARDAALRTWRIIHANVEQGRGYSKLQEVQALEQYYRLEQEALDALAGRTVERTHTFNGSSGGTFRAIGGVIAAERKLRMWLGLPINDGRLIRPLDAPPQAKVVFDWHLIMEEGLTTRPDLRRQQAKVQRYQAELVANRNFLLPQLDFIGRYRWRGYGHGLMGPRNSLQPFNNAFANLTSGQFQEWELGLEYTMPLGFRRGYAAVRNAQVQIARERAILEEQERLAIHDLSGAYADVDRAFRVAQVAYNRLYAAQDQYKRAENAFFNLGGKVSLELVLDSRIRLTDAELAYHRARVDYAVAIKNVHFEKGSLLEYNGAMLANDDYCKGAPNTIAHRVCDDSNDPPINYAMTNPPKQPGAEKKKEQPDETAKAGQGPPAAPASTSAAAEDAKSPVEPVAGSASSAAAAPPADHEPPVKQTWAIETPPAAAPARADRVVPRPDEIAPVVDRAAASPAPPLASLFMRPAPKPRGRMNRSSSPTISGADPHDRDWEAVVSDAKWPAAPVGKSTRLPKIERQDSAPPKAPGSPAPPSENAATAEPDDQTGSEDTEGAAAAASATPPAGP